MGIPKEQLERFKKLFRGLDRTRGQYWFTEITTSERGKVEAQAKTTREPITDEHWQLHFEGKIGVGVVPICEGNIVHFAAIDVDEYDLDVAALARGLAEMKSPFVVTQTKSKGAHLYVYFKDEPPAQPIYKKIKQLIRDFQFPKADHYPAQHKLSDNSAGSWINMPYFGAEKPFEVDTQYARYGFNDAGEPLLSVGEFLDFAESKIVTAQEFLDWQVEGFEDQLFHDGPPCLQRVVNKHEGFGEGSRNVALYNCAIYNRMKFGSTGDRWITETEKMNHELMQPPLLSAEVQQTITSVKRTKSSFYTCQQEPCASHCSRETCLDRKYGIGKDAAGELEQMLERLEKTITKDAGGNRTEDPPHWYLTVSGVTITFSSTRALLSQDRFREKIAERVGDLPPKLRAASWDNIMRVLIQKAKEIEIPMEFGEHGMYHNLLREFCTEKGDAETIGEVLLGKAFHDDEGYTWFLPKKLREYANKQGLLHPASDSKKMYDHLKRMGAVSKQKMIDSTKNQNAFLWRIRSFPKDDDLPIPRKKQEF